MTPVLNPQLLIKSVECCLVQSNCGQCPLNHSGIKFPMCQAQLGNAIADYVARTEGYSEASLIPENP